MQTESTQLAMKRHRLCRDLIGLRDELHLRKPGLAKPTTSMIGHLVSNCPPRLLQHESWPDVIYRALCFLEEKMSPANDHNQQFLRSDKPIPLFPNEDLYDQHDVFLFAKGVLHMRRQQTPHAADGDSFFGAEQIG